ncbi:MAG: thymidine kinase [Mycoplasma sp.]|nr:thymidine kinase [Mycoplasma sp.]
MYRSFKPGMIEIITGPMFAGKSEELIKRIKTLGFAKVKTLVIKPKIDIRWKEEEIVSRAGTSIETFVAKNVKEIQKKWTDDFSAIAIDEAQFFEEDLIPFVLDLAKRGVRVIISCLDMDFKGEPFGIAPTLLSVAEFVTKLKAVCFSCGMAASLTKRIISDKRTILIGDGEYEARCRQCHEKP